MSHAKAKHHHGQIGKALAEKNYGAAMSHTGHLLSALQSAQKAPMGAPTAPDDGDGDEAAPMAPTTKAAPFAGIRDRMAAMKKG